MKEFSFHIVRHSLFIRCLGLDRARPGATEGRRRGEITEQNWGFLRNTDLDLLLRRGIRTFQYVPSQARDIFTEGTRYACPKGATSLFAPCRVLVVGAYLHPHQGANNFSYFHP